VPLKDFLVSTTNSSIVVTSSNFVTSELAQVNFSSIVGSSTNFNTDQVLSNSLVQNKIDIFFIKNNITTVEVLWCIKSVISHKSLRSSEKDVCVFRRIRIRFSNNNIAKKM